MSALNRSETEALQFASTTLSAVLAEGFDPADTKGNTLKKAQIEKAIDGVRTVTTMKGYYPS